MPEIEAERRLVEANREMIARMETRTTATLNRIWGRNLTRVAEALKSAGASFMV